MSTTEYTMQTTTARWTVSAIPQRITVTAGDRDWDVMACKVTRGDGAKCWLWQFEPDSWNWRDKSPFGQASTFVVFSTRGHVLATSRGQGSALHNASSKL